MYQSPRDHPLPRSLHTYIYPHASRTIRTHKRTYTTEIIGSTRGLEKRRPVFSMNATFPSSFIWPDSTSHTKCAPHKIRPGKGASYVWLRGKRRDENHCALRSETRLHFQHSIYAFIAPSTRTTGRALSLGREAQHFLHYTKTITPEKELLCCV